MNNLSDTGQRTKRVIERFDREVYDKGNLQAIDDLLAEDFGHHAPFPTPQGKQGFKGFIEDFRKAFPDGSSETHDLIVKDEKAVIRYTFRGTHEGEFMGAPSTGNEIEVSGISIYRVADGKVTDEWSGVDALGMMQQLGLVPEMGQSQQG